MLYNGTLWLDHDGNLIAVNYESNKEQIKKRELIEKEKSAIHSSLRDYENSITILENRKI